MMQFAMVILFGLLAGIPTALLLLASEQRQERRECDDEGYRQEAAAYLARYRRPYFEGE